MGYIPVIRQWRLGAQTPATEKVLGKRMPRAARRLRFGVSTVLSPNIGSMGLMSSQLITRILGRFVVAAFVLGAEVGGASQDQQISTKRSGR